VIGNHDRFRTVFSRATRILASAHAFHHHRQLRRVTQPVKIIVAEIFFEILSDISG
jgi:hypothetical protein